MSTFKRLLGLLGPQKKWILLVALFGLISNLLAMLGPMWIGQAVDFAAGPGRVSMPGVLGLIGRLLAAYLISAGSGYVVTILTGRIASLTVRDIRAAAFDHLMRLPVGTIDKSPRGDLISRFSNDIDAIGDGLYQLLTQLFTGVLLIIVTLSLMLFLSVKITLVVLIITPLSIFVSSLIVRYSAAQFRAQAQSMGALSGLVEEMVGGQRTVRAYNYQQTAQRRFEKINAGLYDCGQKAQFYASLTNPSTRFVNNIAYVAVGVAAGLSGLLTVGGLSAFLAYAVQFARPINEIAGVTVQLQAALASAKRVFALLDEAPEDTSKEGEAPLSVREGQVRFENVSFSYDPQRPLIKDLSFTARPGSLIAIVGPTGAGKTTLINLLMRFYDPDGGEILIDGAPTTSVSRQSLRRAFGMVLQDTWLFEGTLRDNIAYGRPDAAEEEIVAAAKAAHAHSFIRRLPGGYLTQIGSQGGGLSQGEQQLITIARAMLAAPPMLILDEATSSIDTLTEQRIQRAFRKMMQGRTSFVIAHRLSTIRGADLILVMDKGAIVEAGIHPKLMGAGGLYEKLYQASLAAEADHG